jgi:hypothetical protein
LLTMLTLVTIALKALIDWRSQVAVREFSQPAMVERSL